MDSLTVREIDTEKRGPRMLVNVFTFMRWRALDEGLEFTPRCLVRKVEMPFWILVRYTISKSPIKSGCSSFDLPSRGLLNHFISGNNVAVSFWQRMKRETIK